MTSHLRGGIVCFDGASGAAGDMFLGAAIDAGVPATIIAEAFNAAGIGGHRLGHEKIAKAGIAATNVTIDCTVDGHDHHHDHHHYRDIRARIENASFDEDTRRRALDIFARLAAAEAAIHGTSVDDVAFHEVGAIDSIADVVGAARVLAELAPVACYAPRVCVGDGQVRSAHGILPVPSPAALAILRDAGAVISGGGIARELCTPTGAAILAHAVTAWEAMPAMRPVAIGYGAGDAELPDRPNVLRLTVGHPAAAATADVVVEIQANLDDMSPELCGHAHAALLAAGAIDVWWTPVMMKKARPGFQLTALFPEEHMDAVCAALFAETTTLGVRFCRKQRRVLAREQVIVDTAVGPVAVKIGRDGGRIVNVAPEHESCRAAAEASKTPLKRVYAMALAAFDRNR